MANKIIDQLNFVKSCRQYHLGLRECPSFLFIMMGVLTIIAMLGTYFVAKIYAEIEIVIALMSAVTIVTLVIGNIVINSFMRLAEASKLKSEFVSVASHQLRAPISSIKWSLNLIFGGKLGDVSKEQLEYLEIIKENNEAMRKLVNDLLDVSRIEGDGIKMQPTPTSLVEVARKIIENLSPVARASNVSMNFNPEENLPLVNIDPEKIGSVIQNILDNAIRYIKGKGDIRIKIEKIDKSLKLTISDSGVGIPQHQQRMVFQKFFRAENVMKYETKGTGLGLFISKAVVEQSGGEIGFNSKENEGSTFWFTLPINK